MPRPHDPAYNRDDAQKPGRPQRMAQEPGGAERSSRTTKTITDPASGEARRGALAPDRAEADQRQGAGAGRKAAKDRNLPPD